MGQKHELCSCFRNCDDKDCYDMAKIILDKPQMRFNLQINSRENNYDRESDDILSNEYIMNSRVAKDKLGITRNQSLNSCSKSAYKPAKVNNELTIQKVYRGYYYRKFLFEKYKNELELYESEYIKLTEKEFITPELTNALQYFAKFINLYNKDKETSMFNEFHQKLKNESHFNNMNNTNTNSTFRTNSNSKNNKRGKRKYLCRILVKIFKGVKCFYRGYVNEYNEPYGEGELITKNNTYYKSTFDNRLLIGLTTYIRYNPLNPNEYYEGILNNNILTGLGIKIEEKTNSIYCGDFVNFLKHGSGREECEDSYYEGQYKNDLKNGKGKLKLKKSNEIYEGDFINNHMTGLGCYKFDNGNTYNGQFVDGKMQGKGIYNWVNGGQYKGDYVNNIKEGNGIFKWGDGRIFKGPFKDGKPHGKGVLIYKKINFDVEFDNGKLVGNYKKNLNKKKKTIKKELNIKDDDNP